MAGADEGSRIRDVVRGSKIRSDILRKLDRKLGSYKSELNQGTIEIQNCSEQFQSHGRVLPRSAKGVEDCTYVGRLGRNRSPTAGSERRSNLQEANRRWVRSYLPLFKRTSNKEDLFNWFDAVDHFFEETQPPETMKCELASYVLDGEAERWWQNFQQQRLLYGESEIKLWPRMKFILSNDFWPAKCSTNFPNQLNKQEGKEVVKHTKSDGPSLADCLIEVPLESFNSGKNQIDCWGSTNEFHYSNSSTTDVCENTKCGVLPSDPAEHDKVVDDTDINLQQSVNCYTVGAIEFAANNLDMKKTTYAFEPPTTTPLVASAKSTEEEIPIVAETSEGITGHIQPESKFHSPELLVCVGECDDKRKADQTIGVETEYGMVEELGREAPIVTLPNAKVHRVNEVLHSQLDGCDTERYKIGVVPVLVAFDGDRIERLRNSFGATILPLARDQRLLYVVVHESSTHSVQPHFQFVEPNSDLNSAKYVNLEMMLPELSVGDLIGRCGPNTSRIDEYVYSLMMLEVGAVPPMPIIPGTICQSNTLLQVYGHNEGVIVLFNFDPGGYRNIDQLRVHLVPPYGLCLGVMKGISHEQKENIGTYFVGWHYHDLQLQVHPFYSDASTPLHIDVNTMGVAIFSQHDHTLGMSWDYSKIEMEAISSLNPWNCSVLDIDFSHLMNNVVILPTIEGAKRLIALVQVITFCVLKLGTGNKLILLDGNGKRNPLLIGSCVVDSLEGFLEAVQGKRGLLMCAALFCFPKSLSPYTFMTAITRDIVRDGDEIAFVQSIILKLLVVWLCSCPCNLIFKKSRVDVKFGFVETEVPTCDVYGKLIDIFMRDGLEADKYAEEELEKMALDKLFIETTGLVIILDILKSCFFLVDNKMISAAIHYLIENSKTLQGAKESEIQQVLVAKRHAICVTVRLMGNVVMAYKYNELLWGKLKLMLFHGHWNCNFYMTRGRVIPWEGWNDENNCNTSIMARRSVGTISLYLSIVGKSGHFRRTLKLFHKVVNGLDPPMDLLVSSGV